MKKIYAIIISTFLTANLSLFGQGFYVSPQIGFAAGTNQQAINFSYSDGDYNVEDQLKYSFGKGFSAGLSVGYMFNKNIGVDLDLNYLIGGKSSMSYTVDEATSEMTLYSRMFRINPSLLLTMGEGKWHPYTKFGFILGIGKGIVEESYSNNGNGSFQKIEFSGGAAPGFTASLGLLYDLNESLQLFGEAHLISMTYAPEKGKLTEATVNGEDVLDQFTVSEKEIEFIDSRTYLPSSFNPNEPSRVLKEYLPFSSLGLKVGVRFNF